MGWSGGLSEWHDGDTVCLSVAFTWRLDEAAARAVFYRALGKRVLAGGPALFLPQMRHELHELAEVRSDYPDAIARHNPHALEREPWVRFDWTAQRLRDVARWANGWVWKRAAFAEYDRARKSRNVQPMGELFA